YYDAQRMRGYRVVDLGLIAAGALIVPRLSGPLTALVALLMWFLALVVALGWRARDRQRNETASDRRAVALTGNADALARGLTKLHTFARLPRRYDVEREQRATHPSLARRIRDLRAAAGLEAAPLQARSTFTDPEAAHQVTFG